MLVADRSPACVRANTRRRHWMALFVPGEAIGYARNQWVALTSHVTDGRLLIDSNDTKRDLRQLTIGRKNWLCLGSPEAGPRAAILYSVVASAVRHDLDVWAYLCDVFDRLASAKEEGNNDLDLAALLPDVWAQSHPEAIRTYRAHEREATAAAARARRHKRRVLARAAARLR